MRFFTLLLLALGFSAFSQNIPYGKWVFQDLGDTTIADAEGLAFGRMFFGSFYLTLQENGLYQTSVMEKVSNGYIDFDKSTDSIIHLISEDEESLEVEVLDKTEDNIRIKMRGKMDFLLQRTDYQDTLFMEDLRNKPEGIVFNPDLLVNKKWHYIHTSSSENKEVVEAVEAIIQDGYIVYSSDGTFEQHIIGLDLEGTWKTNDNQTSITTYSEDLTRLWFVKELNESTLKLLIPHSRKMIELQSN
jgi:hypothetical protein